MDERSNRAYQKGRIKKPTRMSNKKISKPIIIEKKPNDAMIRGP
jgi:hypothetical protein